MLEPLLDHPLVLRLGQTLMHSLWQGAALAGLLAVGMGLVGSERNRSRHTLATVTLLVWLAAPVATFVALAPKSVDVAGTQSGSPAVAANASSVPGAVEQHDSTTNTALPGTIVSSDGQVGTPSWRRVLPYATLTWLAFSAVMSLRLLGGLVMVRRLGARGTPLPALEATLASLGARLGVHRSVRLLASCRVDAPTVLGWLRPVILLPASALSGLTPAQLELVLAHELAHIRRHDYLVSVLYGVAEALLYYHPLTWWLGRALRVEREHVCDDLALAATGAKPLDLAETLAELEVGRAVPLPALAATGSLVPRIRRLLGRTTPAAGIAHAVLPALALVPLGLWLALSAQASSPENGFFERRADGLPIGGYFASPEGDWGALLSLNGLIAQASFPVRAPTDLPEGFRFDNATWSEELQAATLTFASSHERQGDDATMYLTLLQAPARTYLPVPIGEGAILEPITVGSLPGEYVRGHWADLRSGPAGETDAHWEDAAGQILAWQDAGMVYVLVTDPVPTIGTETLSREALLQVGRSLVAMHAPPGEPATSTPVPSSKTRKWATLSGDITLREDYGDLASIGQDGSMIIEERSPAGVRRVVVTAGEGGAFVYQYSEDGAPRPLEGEALAWYRRLLDELVLQPLAERERDPTTASFGTFTGRRDSYQSLIGLPAGRTYDVGLRGLRGDRASWLHLSEVEQLTHAAAHGLVHQGLLVVALSYFVSQPALGPDEVDSLQYAIRHVEDLAERQRLSERLDREAGDTGS